MRILQVITSLYTGGAESLVVNLILRMQAKGHIVDLVVFNGYETPLMEKLRRESPQTKIYKLLSLIHISEPTRQCCTSRMPSSA